jgi:large subunit ribosomal protein L19
MTLWQTLEIVMKNAIIADIEKRQMEKILEKRKLPEFGPGDTLQVNVRIQEGERIRIQAYEGLCISRQGGGLQESFTVRKISYGEGVERLFPIYSPNVESVKVLRRGRVRRAKLYYLRNLRGKAARIVERKDYRPREAAQG